MLEIEKESVIYDKKTPKNKQESEIAHTLLNKMLKKHFNIINPELKKTDNGKPYIENENVFFSLSHTDGKVICAVSDKNVGIDIEKITAYDIAKIKRIAGRFFTTSEKALLEKNNYDTVTFLKIWTRKEAYIKLLGENLSQLAKTDTENLNIETYIDGEYIVSIAKDE